MNGNTRARIEARDAALRLINRITTWVSVGAVAGVAALGGIAAATIPGTASSSSPSQKSASTNATSAPASNSTSTSTTTTASGSSTTSSSGLRSSTGVSSAPSSTPVVVSGGSR